MPSIVVENLKVTYRDKKNGENEVIDGLFANFEGDGINVIAGESGCGKTTLLRAVAGLIPYEGKIFFDGADVSDLKPHERGLSLVSQEYVLYSHMTLFDNIAFPLKNVGAPRKEIIERVYELAEVLDLEICLTRRPAFVSGGQQQRAALARALVKRPSVCLLDEPLSNVDAQARIKERRFIKEALKKYGCTALYVTHDTAEAMAMADKLFVMADKKIAVSGAPREVFSSAHPAARALFFAEELPW